MQIRGPQIAAFDQHLRAAFERRLLAYLKESFPERCAAMGDEAVAAVVRRGLAAAAGYGFEYEDDLANFMRLMFRLGVDFTEHPVPVWASMTLSELNVKPVTRLSHLDRQAHFKMNPAPPDAD